MKVTLDEKQVTPVGRRQDESGDRGALHRQGRKTRFGRASAANSRSTSRIKPTTACRRSSAIRWRVASAASHGSKIAEDGTAFIELVPTTKTGEVVLTFTLERASKAGDSRLAGAGRSVTGFWSDLREGTLGHKQLSGNMEALNDADADDKLFDESRLAFYAKGQIKGEYLLTIAYDTAKERGRESSDEALKQAIDPNRFYTLYGDATDPQFDAASIRKLYLRIEKSQFYALFGDYDTGLTVTEFARYSRTLNGLKSEYQGKTFAYNAFAALTAQAFVKDEIPGDGTSGLYRLSRRNIADQLRQDPDRDARSFPQRRSSSAPARCRAIWTTTSTTDWARCFFREPIPVARSELQSRLHRRRL